MSDQGRAEDLAGYYSKPNPYWRTEPVGPFLCDPDESAGLAESEILQTFVLQLIGPRSSGSHGYPFPYQMVRDLREAEENLTDLLPEGYSVRIMEWDAKEDE